MNHSGNQDIVKLEKRDEWPLAPLVPQLRSDLHIRTANVHDVGFIDQMQKLFQGNLGFLYRSVMERRVAAGQVRIAVDSSDVPFGLCMFQHRYMGRDDVGIVFQLAVVPMRHRKQVGAALIRDFFEHAPFGMKLACCWCAQDLPACYFWEAMGFIPLAFRTGSRGRRRIHIFWIRRVNEDDIHTQLWYPPKTGNGSIAEDRIVLPIPPGHSWKEPLPNLLPGVGTDAGVPLLPNGLPDPKAEERTTKSLASRTIKSEEDLKRAVRLRHSKLPPDGYTQVGHSGNVRMVMVDPELAALAQRKRKECTRAKKPRHKVSDELVQKAHQLRDRFTHALLQHRIAESGKYTPARTLPPTDVNLEDFQCKLPENQSKRLE